MTIELILTEFNKSTLINTLVYDRKDVANLNSKLIQLKIENVTVQQDDAQYLRTLLDGYAKQLMLLDVLEHVEDDNLAIAAAYRVLKKGGILLISVPTPCYRIFFGAKFDEYIGHRRHYLLEDLKPLLEHNNFRIREFFYYTSSTPSRVCALLYDKLTAQNILGAVLMDVIKAALFPVVALIGLDQEVPSKKMQNHSSLIILAEKD
jgi:SAM-dependent methyltransferase